MDTTHLTAIIGIILVLSIASERLVEMIKGLSPYLSKQKSDPKAEGRRRSALQCLAMLAGVFTALLAKDYITNGLGQPSGHWWSIFGLGLLASGGSGFWNSVLTYVSNAKDLQKAVLAGPIAHKPEPDSVEPQ